MTPDPQTIHPARILIVDDQPGQRLKLSLAVQALGHVTETASDGSTALSLLENQDFDLVLLDILMPGVSGFDVLRQMKQDSVLREIPVIVISALGQEMDSVVEAIGLGAEDFMPKSFQPALLRARINASLRKKYNRNREIEHLAQIKRLTDAARLLEQTLINPASLKLDDMRERNDSLGNLSRVFTDMTRQVFDRECKLYRQIRTLKGGGLLLLVGTIFGLAVPMSKIAVEIEAHPFGLSLWINGISAVICLSISIFRKTLPSPNWYLLRTLFLWGLIGNAGSEVLLFWSAQRLPASTIAILIVCEGLMVFAYAIVTKQEATTLRRFVGLITGLVGIVVLITTYEGSTTNSSLIWMAIALTVPACYAFEDIVIAAKLPENLDFIAAFGLASLFGVLCLLPVSWLTNDLIAINLIPGRIEIAIYCLALTSIVGTVFLARLLISTGAVFGSQAGYIITFAGIAWSIVLLGEQLSLMTWIAVGLLIAGLVLVEPKREAEENLSFSVN